MTFDNGYTVSVQWGACTYSDHHNLPEYDGHDPDQFINWFHSPWQANNKEFDSHIRECKKVNRHIDKRHKLCFTPETLSKGWHSNTAEVAVWTMSSSKEDPQRTWYDPITLTTDNNSDVKGWLQTDEVAEIISNVANIKTKGDNPLIDLLEITDKIVDKGKTIWTRSKPSKN